MIDRLTSDGCCTFPASAGHADKHAQPCSARDCTSSLAPTFNCRIASTASAGVRSRASATDIQSRDNACVCDVLYVCMYVCMYVCNVCTYVRTYVCMSVCTESWPAHSMCQTICIRIACFFPAAGDIRSGVANSVTRSQEHEPICEFFIAVHC